MLCWLDCHATDLEAEVEGRKGADLKVRAFHDRRRERAHKRYLSALKVLAQVRKLALPAIQVNIKPVGSKSMWPGRELAEAGRGWTGIRWFQRIHNGGRSQC